MATGRSNVVRGQAEGWLGRHAVSFEQMLMRAQGDHQPDHRLKRSWNTFGRIDRERGTMVFKDRYQMVAMWRELGLACLQVAPGERASRAGAD